MKSAADRKVRAHARVKERFIRRLAESGNVADSMRKAGIPQRTGYEWRKSDSDFAALWTEAVDIAADGLIDEARRRAVEGWTEPVYQQGKQVGTIRRYSDRMLEILIKGHRPQYRENPASAVQVNIGDAMRAEDRQATLLEIGRNIGIALRMADGIQAQPAAVPLLPAYTAPGAALESERAEAPAVDADAASAAVAEREAAEAERLFEAEVTSELRRRGPSGRITPQDQLSPYQRYRSRTWRR